MTLLTGFLDLLTVSRKFVLLGVLLSSKVTLGWLQVLDLLDSSFFVLFSVLLELLKLLFLIIKSLSEIFDSLARGLNLLLHADSLLKRGSKTNRPEVSHFCEGIAEASDIVCCSRAEVLTMQLGLHTLIFEKMYELHDIWAHLVCVSDSLVLQRFRLLEISCLEVLHMQPIDRQVDIIEACLSFGLCPEQSSCLRSKFRFYNLNSYGNRYSGLDNLLISSSPLWWTSLKTSCVRSESTFKFAIIYIELRLWSFWLIWLTLSFFNDFGDALRLHIGWILFHYDITNNY